MLEHAHGTKPKHAHGATPTYTYTTHRYTQHVSITFTCIHRSDIGGDKGWRWATEKCNRAPCGLREIGEIISWLP